MKKYILLRFKNIFKKYNIGKEFSFICVILKKMNVSFNMILIFYYFAIFVVLVCFYFI